jgi:hypothetical protein
VASINLSAISKKIGAFASLFLYAVLSNFNVLNAIIALLSV